VSAHFRDAAGDARACRDVSRIVLDGHDERIVDVGSRLRKADLDRAFPGGQSGVTMAGQRVSGDVLQPRLIAAIAVVDSLRLISSTVSSS
jgi:hypothetical protein